MRTVSAICLPMVIVGLSEVIGSWKTIPISLPRTLRISASLSSTRSRPSKTDLAAGDVPAAGEQAHDRHRGHRLAAAGLADDADRLARLDLEAQAVDGVDGAAAQPDLRLEVVDLEQVRHRRQRSCSRTSNASCSASPMKLKATTVITMITSAGYTSHQ